MAKFDILSTIKALIRGTINISKLERDGFQHGKNFHAQEGVIIDPGHCWLIEVGDNVTLAPRVHILAHDASTKIPLGMTKVGRVIIGNNVFIGASSVVLPNVRICDNVVIGAGSVVSKDILQPGVYCGVPAKLQVEYSLWVQDQKNRLSTLPSFGYKYTIDQITPEMKDEMRRKLNHSSGFIV